MSQSWNGAPPLIEVVASQMNIAGYTGQVWGITQHYQLITSSLGPPLTPWSTWSQPDWDGAPDQIFGVAACQQGNTLAQIFVIDNDMQLWSAVQTQYGNWSSFDGPRWNEAPLLQRICASQQGGGRGAQLFGITDTGSIVSCYQAIAGDDGSWSGWLNFNGPAPSLWLTASLQNDPRIQLFALDEKQSLWTNFQTTPGGGWAGFEGPQWNSAPAFEVITSVAQGGSRGAQVWGVDGAGVLWTCYEQVSGGQWSDWIQSVEFGGAPPFVRIAAAQLANGEVMFWGIDQNLNLWAIQQLSPGGEWGPWVHS